VNDSGTTPTPASGRGEYYDSGLLKKQTNGSGASIERSYDGLERIVSHTLTPTGNGAYNGTFS
jgi:YD repeat-containing protein